MRFPLWLRRADADRALDEEIRTHLAMAVADRVARGESPEDAEAAARREFGNVAHVKEVTREAWGGVWLERLLQDVRYALRSLRRAPAFTSVAVATMALGIGANTAMFTVVRSVLLRPLPFRDPGALYFVANTPDRARAFADHSMADREYLEYRRAQHSFATTTSYGTFPATLLGAEEPLRLQTAGVTASFFGTLGVRPALGRPFADGEDRPGSDAIVIIGDRLWREHFGGDPAAIGRSVTLDGSRKTIVGVMPPGFDFPQHAQLWMPRAVTASPQAVRLQPVIGRLAPHATPARALAELQAFVRANQAALFGDRVEHTTPEVIPLREGIVGDVRPLLLTFAAAVGVVLLIACANVSNLMLMRAATRRHEFGVRGALGAGRWRLVRQLLTESLVVALAGGVLGLAVAYAGVALLLAAAPADLIPRAAEIHADPTVLAVMALTCLGAGVIAGTAPAVTASRRDVREALSDAARSTTTRAPLRAVFVTVEASLALVLLIGAGLLIRSFVRLRHVDLGFAPDHLVTATLDLPETRYPTPELLRDVQHRLAARATAIPGVRSAAAVNWLPLTTTAIMGDFTLADGRQLPPGYVVLKPCVTSGYFATMGIRVRAGRDFRPTDDAASARVAVVSEAVARRFWPGESAIGKQITMQDRPQPSDWMTIVGVVDDVVQGGPAESRAEAIYQALDQVAHPAFIRHVTIVVRAADPAGVAAALRRAVRAVDPQQPVESIMTMESRLGAVVAEPRFRSLLLLVFSALALVLAVVGIYGVLAYAVAERTRELGIRLALGAAPGALVRLVLATTARLTMPGLLLGIAASVAVTRLLSTFLFGVRPIDPATFAGASVLLLCAALCAGLGPARRASRIDPVITMKG